MKRFFHQTAARRTVQKIGPSVVYLLILAGCATPELPPLPPSASDVRSTAPAAIEQGDGRAKPITVEEAIERAEVCSPRLHALRAAVLVAKQRKSAASDIEDPEVLAAWGNISDEFGDTTNTPGNQNQRRIGGRFYVPNPFLVAPRVSARTAELLATKADLQAAKWLVECDVRRLFAELDYLAEDMALAEDLVRQSAEILKDVQTRAGQGVATAPEVVAASQRQLQTQNDWDQTRHRYQLAQRELAALLDKPVAPLQISTNALTYPSLPRSAVGIVEPLQQVALQCRGDVTALRWRTLEAKSAYREGLNVRVPWFKELTVWNREPSDQWWLGVSMTMPIFSWTKNHADDVLQAQCNLAGANESNEMQLVRRELRDALDEVQEQGRQQTRNQAEVVPLLGDMHQTLLVLKRTPNLMPSQVAATEVQILESSRIELASRWRYHLAVLNLERVVGQPLSEALAATTRHL